MTVKTPLPLPEDDLEVAPELEQEFLRLDKRLDWVKRLRILSLLVNYLLIFYGINAIIVPFYPLSEGIEVFFASVVIIFGLFSIFVGILTVYKANYENETRSLFVKITNETDAKANINPLYRVGKYKYIVSKFYKTLKYTAFTPLYDWLSVLIFSLMLILVMFYGLMLKQSREQQAQIDSLNRTNTSKLKEYEAYTTYLQEREKKLASPYKPSEVLPAVDCKDTEKCLKELEIERDEAKRKSLIDALLPHFDRVRIVGSSGTQVGIYSQERGNLWIGLDKIGDRYYKCLYYMSKKDEIVLELQVSNQEAE